MFTCGPGFFRSAVATAFSPTQLFAAGERGAWWDPSDFSTMFQDTAGTVPVTAVGQTVKLLKDKSGNGNDLSSSVAPTLAQDGSGYYYLQFTGASTQYLLCSGSRPLQLGYDSFISVAACKFDDASTYYRTLYARSLAGPGAGRYFQSAAVAVGNSNHNYAWGSGASNVYSGGADTATTNRVMVGDINRVTGVIATLLNGVVLGSNGSFTPDTGTNMNNTNRFILGAYNDASDTGVAAPMNGRVYGIILRLVPTNNDALRAKAQTWMGAKCGITV